MPRDIPVGNGKMLVAFDRRYRICDFYYPHVGKENHSGGHPFRFGVWCEGRFSWVDSDDWHRTLAYIEDTLVTEVTLIHPAMGLRLVCNDGVDFHRNVYLKRLSVENQADREREVRLFFHHDFHIFETEVGDTAYFRPDDLSLVHYKGQRYFFINCCTDEKCGWDQFATGYKEVNGAEGTWRDAEDGVLGGNPIAQGAVDSTVAVHLSLPAHGTAKVGYWIAAGPSYPEVRDMNTRLLEKGFDELLNRTANYWRLWTNAAGWPSDVLPDAVLCLFKRSLLILRAHIDAEGAIIAAADSDVLQFNRDTYCYMWPRDGALVAYALDLAGYPSATVPFYYFCRYTITDEGCMLHKYNADKSLGSSWHPWYADGQSILPIQEDETALVIWALWHHFRRYRDIEALRGLYRPLIVRAGNFMRDYRDHDTGLPRPSYDLWEERRGVFAFTVGAVYGGLQAAANFAQAFGETALAESYRQAAQEIKAATDKYLWRDDVQRFARGLDVHWGPSHTAVDLTIDASLYGLFYFGMYAADDWRIASTMAAVQRRLWVQTPVGGIARYENDYYHQVRHDIDRVAGNPWIVCTLWLAQWYIAQAHSLEDLRRAEEMLRWVAAHALASGVLAEQVHPDSGAPLSVSPLTWSHGTFVTVVMEYLDKLAQLTPCQTCGAPGHGLHPRTMP
jgi:glucoamylase